MPVSVSLGAKQRCPLCHQRVSAQQRLVACACHAVYHGACLREFGGCATLGCSHHRPASRRPARRARRLPQAPPLRLDDLAIASPCPTEWSSMEGDDRVRFCGQCELNVYNLSALSRTDALALVEKTEGRRCVRLLRRADNTVITDECPHSLRRMRNIIRGVLVASGVAALLGLAGLGTWFESTANLGYAGGIGSDWDEACIDEDLDK